LRVKREKNYSSNAEYVFTSLEVAHIASEAFIHKEVMLYKISLLEEDHAEKSFSSGLESHPHYQRMQNFKSGVRTYMGV
jgi:hypothetical protein